MQQQYAFIIPIAIVAAKFSNDDTGGKDSFHRYRYTETMFCEEGSSFVVRKVQRTVYLILERKWWGENASLKGTRVKKIKKLKYKNFVLFA
jgi:hypothetical protein